MSQFDLRGKVAVISGGSRGIGEAMARAYAEAGANVVISSRKIANVAPVAEAINGLDGGRALAVEAHAGQTAAAQNLITQAVETFGRVDIAVNNAATNPHFGPMLSAQESHWDKIVEVNLKGYFFLTQAAALQMQKQGDGGKIINIASVAGLKPGPGMGIYSVSKAGVIMMTQVLAVELAADNIQVNAIAPGFIKTKFSSAVWGNDALLDGVIHKTPSGRIADPEELTGIALYLAAAASNFTTGAVFTIDGGYILT